tara:strand:- start:2267 stop:2533 length:267 start_codon:yes stop_codon:yes gene_type:complete
MARNAIEKTEVNLAVYMERLDSYIDKQTNINASLNAHLQNVNTQISDINLWRNRVYGAKALAIAFGVITIHTAAILGSIAAMINLMNK